MNEQNNRSSFSGKIGFILAAAGSAVGLGNIWRFPYLAAQYGGGIFLLVYLILSVTFGFSLMAAEIAIGRKTGLSAVCAFKKLNNKYSFIGYIASIIPILILPYYSVIGGWIVKYFGMYLTGNGSATVSVSFFDGFVSKPVEPLIWFTLFIGVTAVVVFFGVSHGVERVSKFLMPVLVVLAVAISVYVCFMEGALEGVKYYILPDFSKFSIKTVVGAMGQLFYSMSLAMGIMITYGSYMKKNVNLESSVKSIEFFDLGIAFAAGLMIIPAVFSSASVTGAAPEEMLVSGPTLMFKVLPTVFDKMPAGGLIGCSFFLLVIFAALTSSISLMEAIVSIIDDKFKIGRKRACLVTFIISLLFGVPSSLGNGIWSNIKILDMDFLTFFDFLSNSILMPIVAFLTCVFVGYVIKPKTLIEEIELTGKFKQKLLFNCTIKYIAPVCIFVILISAVFGQLGIFKI